LIKLSIIIPFSQNEKDISLLFDIKKKFKNYEIIFVGSSKNNFVKKNINIIKKIAKVFFVKNSNRAKSLNFGAFLAKNNLLWFLHLDSNISKIPKNFFNHIDRSKINSFKLKFKKKKFFLNYFGANIRSKILKNPFGDQSYIVEKDIFYYVNRFDEKLNEGEDHEFIIRSVLKRIKINIINYYLISSSRKYEKKGHLVLTLIYFYKTLIQIFLFYFKNLKFFNNEFIIVLFTKHPFSKNSKKRLRIKISDNIVNKFNKNVLYKTILEVKKINFNKLLLAIQEGKNQKETLKYFMKYPKILISSNNLNLAMKKIYFFLIKKYKKIIFIGSDIPELDHKDIIQSIKQLNNCNNYFIRTYDGGFCLFGTKDKTIENVFLKVKFSKKNTLFLFLKLLNNVKVSQKIYEDIDNPIQLKKYYANNKKDFFNT